VVNFIPERLSLQDVTLAAVGNVAHQLTKMAFEDCMKEADFGDYLILSDKEILPGVRHVNIPSESGEIDALRLAWDELPKHVETKFFLRIEWDSWIINRAMWCNEYLRYDYIGAGWPHLDGPYAVGNGGFSLRSVDLMLALAKLELPYRKPEDAVLCRDYRPHLERHGFRWAPLLLARCFASELTWEPFKSFGFHGMFNWVFVLTREEIEHRLSFAPEYVLKTPQYQQLMKNLATDAVAPGFRWQ
jgi:Protein of unknown function (DUF5672)